MKRSTKIILVITAILIFLALIVTAIVTVIVVIVLNYKKSPNRSIAFKNNKIRKDHPKSLTSTKKLDFDKNNNNISTNISKPKVNIGKLLYDQKEIDNLKVDYVLQNISKVYYINLDKRPDRDQEFKNRYLWNMKNVARFSAAYGKEIIENPMKKANKDILKFAYPLFEDLDNFRKESPRRLGEIGCALSHMLLWDKVAKDSSLKENDIVLLLEDDAMFFDNSVKLWDEFSKSLPKEFDLLYFGQGGGKGEIKIRKSAWPSQIHAHCPKYNDSFIEISNLKSRVSTPKHQSMKNESCCFTTLGYMITKAGAKKLLQVAKNNPTDTSIDNWLWDNWTIGNFKAYAPNQWITYSDFADSDISSA